MPRPDNATVQRLQHLAKAVESPVPGTGLRLDCHDGHCRLLWRAWWHDSRRGGQSGVQKSVIRYGYEGAFRLAAMARQEGLYGQTENLLEADSIPLPPELPQELQHLVSCAEYVAHSPDKRDAVRRDYETSNLTTNLLVQKHNIPENTLWRWAREGKWVRKIRLGVTAKRTGRLPEIDRCQKDLAFWLWCHSELPIPAIAARVKVSISTIKRWRRQHRRQYDNPVERAHWLYAETNTPIDDIAWRTGLDVRHLLKLATTHGWVRGEPITTVPAYSISPGFLRQLEGLSVPI